MASSLAPSVGSSNTGDLESVDKLYTSLMFERKDELVRRLDNVDEVLERLTRLNVLTLEEQEAVVCKPMQQHQKEALISLLAGKSFASTKLILAGLYQGPDLNADLISQIKLVIKMVYCENPNFDKNQVANVPEICLPEPKAPPLPTPVSIATILNIYGGTTAYTAPASTPATSPENTSGHPTLPPGHAITTDGETGDDSAGRLGENFKKHSSQYRFSEPTKPPEQCVYLSPPRRTMLEPSESFYNEEISRVSKFVQLELPSGLKAHLRTVRSINALIDPDAETGRTSLHVCVSRERHVEECLRILLERYKELEAKVNPRMSYYKFTANAPEKLLDQSGFIDRQDNKGQTAVHLAAQNQLVDVIKLLYSTSRCNLLIENKDGETPLQIMYLKTPMAVRMLLDDAIIGTSGSPTDPEYEMKMDFTFIIGRAPQKFGVANDRKYHETSILVDSIVQNSDTSNILLSHVLVKFFIHLKWRKMRFWLYFSTILQRALHSSTIFAFQLFLHSWYAVYILQVFVVSCRLRTYNGRANASINVTVGSNQASQPSPTPIRTEPNSLYEYAFGKSDDIATPDGVPCFLDSFWAPQTLLILALGIAFLVKSSVEIIVKVVHILSSRIHSSKIKTAQNVFYYYWQTSDEIYQLACGILMIIVARSIYSGVIYESDYVCAAMSLLTTAKPVLMYVGELTNLGIYVRILGKVTKHFVQLMIAYFVIILAFSMALSIVFPYESSVKRLPESIIRVFIMMVGEIDSKEFNGSNADDLPKLLVASQLILICLIILLTIILTNLLVGLVVTDVKTLKESAEIFMLAGRLDKLAMVETTLIRVQPFFSAAYKMWYRLTRNPQDLFDFGIYIIPIYDQHKNGFGIKTSIKEIPDDMRRELIQVALKQTNSKASCVCTNR